MALLLKNLLGRNAQFFTASVKSFGGPIGSRQLCPAFLGPVVVNERSYRWTGLDHRGRRSQARRKAINFFENEALFNNIIRHLSTVSGQGDLVYKGRIGHLFKVLKVFSLTTSSIGLAVQPYLLMTYADMSLAAALPMFGAINMFVFLNPILIHFVAKKYVSELYFDPQSGVFTAVLMTFFARRMHFTFKASDVKVPDVPGPFSMLTAKGKPLFVHEADFQDLKVYKHLMGFDRPLNLVYPPEKRDKDE